MNENTINYTNIDHRRYKDSYKRIFVNNMFKR